MIPNVMRTPTIQLVCFLLEPRRIGELERSLHGLGPQAFPRLVMHPKRTLGKVVGKQLEEGDADFIKKSAV